MGRSFSVWPNFGTDSKKFLIFTKWENTEGKVEIIIANSNELIDQLGEGEYFGDISLVLKEKRTASVRTISYCDLFVLTEKDFIHIKNKYPEFKEVLKQSAAHKSEKMAELILKDIIL